MKKNGITKFNDPFLTVVSDPLVALEQEANAEAPGVALEPAVPVQQPAYAPTVQPKLVHPLVPRQYLSDCPRQLFCNQCNVSVLSKIKYRVGNMTLAFAGGLLLVCCCCIPLFVNG